MTVSVGLPAIASRTLVAKGAPTPRGMTRPKVLSRPRMLFATAWRWVTSPARATDSGLADSDERFVTALRRTKARILIEVGLADLAGEISVREATSVLSALADACLETSVRQALGTERGRRERRGHREEHDSALLGGGQQGAALAARHVDADHGHVGRPTGSGNGARQRHRVAGVGDDHLVGEVGRTQRVGPLGTGLHRHHTDDPGGSGVTGRGAGQ